MISEGSIISASSTVSTDLGDEVVTTQVTTISLIKEIKGNELYCSDSICSINGGDYKPTKKVYPRYEGEVLGDGVRLIDSDEFDIVIDTNIIDRSKLKNL